VKKAKINNSEAAEALSRLAVAHVIDAVEKKEYADRMYKKVGLIFFDLRWSRYALAKRDADDARESAANALLNLYRAAR